MENYYPVVRVILIVVCTLVVMWLLLLVNKHTFKRIHEKQKELNLLFFEKMIGLIIVVTCIIIGFSFIGGMQSVLRTMLGSTAIISALVVFAAQDVIKDILAGLMLSLHKPFEIGNRIELEDGTAGVIRDITMRHVIIHTWGSQEIIVPNSKLNSMMIKNDSYQSRLRSIQMTFHIGYGSDVEKAMDVIKQVVMDSQYTVPGKQTSSGKVFDDVYFMGFESSSLCLQTTVYYSGVTPTEVIKSDINTRVNQAFLENNIEIPFNYINVIQK